MSDNNNLPQKKDSAEVALQKTTSLLSITNKILANIANRTLVVSDDAWLDELIAWADKNNINATTIPREIEELTQLTKLSLSPSQLPDLPKEIGQLKQLTELDLHMCFLYSLPKEIGNLTKLTKLALSFNSLSKIPKEIGKLTQLKQLTLGNNVFLEELPKEITQLTQLTWLELRNNNLTLTQAQVEWLNRLEMNGCKINWSK